MVGFYVENYERNRELAESLKKLIVTKVKKNLSHGHFMIQNIFSCKHSYKKKVEMKVLKELIKEIINEYEFPNATMSTNNDNCKELYSSLFNVYNTCDEFIEKNLIKLTDVKSFITNNWKIKWNSIILNKRNNDQIARDPNNYKWLKYISQINFINDLITISDILRFLPLTEREGILKEFILYLNKEKFPCKLYDPLQIKNVKNDQVELLRIDERLSYPINTRERVPCHLIFEYNSQEKIIENNEQNSYKDLPGERVSVIIPKIQLTTQGDQEEYYQSKPFFSGLWVCFGDTGAKNSTPVQIRANIEEDAEDDEDNTLNKTPSAAMKNENIVNSIGVFGAYSFSNIQQKSLSESKYKNKPYHNKNRFIISSIIKGNDELRQDYFVSQVITLFNYIFSLDPSLPIHLKPCKVTPNGIGGFIQTIIDSTSLAKINKIQFSYDFPLNSPFNNFFKTNQLDYQNFSNLKNYFNYKFGNNYFEYDKELYQFIFSLSGYCLLCYFLEIKDRNNGNILLNNRGQLIHIDFGFLFNKSPGNIAFEKAPFKFTRDFLDLMEGNQSRYYLKFQETFCRGFILIRKYKNYLLKLTEIFCDLFSDLDCFSNKEEILSRLNEKFMSEVKNEDEIAKKCNELIQISIDNWRTSAYDKYQKFCVGVN